MTRFSGIMALNNIESASSRAGWSSPISCRAPNDGTTRQVSERKVWRCVTEATDCDAWYHTIGVQHMSADSSALPNAYGAKRLVCKFAGGEKM